MRARESLAEIVHANGIWFAVDPVQKFPFVQEKIAGQHALAIEFFEKKGGG